MRRIRTATLVGLVLAVVMGFALPAAAEINGPCNGTGNWDTGLTVDARRLQPGEVLIIPRDATVAWVGSIDIAAPEESRPVSGWVKVKLPFPIGEVTVGDWSDTATMTSNSGSYDYDLPTVLSGFDVTVTGSHWEGNSTFSGEPTCSGTVTLQMEGTNPAGFVTGGLTVVTLAGAFLSVRAKGPSAGGGTRR